MMSIRARLTAAFAAIGLLLLLQVGVAHYSTARNAADLEAIVDAHEASNTMTVLALEGQKMRRFEKEYFIYADNPAKRANYSTDFFAAHDRLKSEFVRLSSRLSEAWGADDKARVSTWDEALNAYARGFTRVELQVTNGTITDTNGANQAIQDAKNQFKVFLNGSAEQIGLKYQRAQALASDAEARQRRTQIALYVLTFLGVVVAAVMVFYVPLVISRPLTQLTVAANEMSKGKIRDDIPVTGPPEIRDLAESMDRLRVALRGILQRLQANRPADTVTTIGAGTGTATATSGTRQA